MSRHCQLLDLGLRAYEPVVAVQEDLVARRKLGTVPDTLILVEHEPVYTLGRGADARHVLASTEELVRRGIQVVQTGRGGDVTYHGPGQLVGYPILDLGERGKGVVWYVEQLEEVLIRALAEFGVTGARDSRNRGVWIGREKIAAIGVRVTRRITMHGFALNVRTDLAAYGGIVPCGLADRGVTSLHNLVPAVTMAEAKQRVLAAFVEVFEFSGVTL